MTRYLNVNVNSLIRRKYKVKYSNVHVWELLQALGFGIQKPRPRHYKHASDEEIDRFKETLPGWYAIIDKKGS